eukprot:5264816-Karenia_brevis.AAC.1
MNDTVAAWKEEAEKDKQKQQTDETVKKEALPPQKDDLKKAQPGMRAYGDDDLIADVFQPIKEKGFTVGTRVLRKEDEMDATIVLMKDSK